MVTMESWTSPLTEKQTENSGELAAQNAPLCLIGHSADVCDLLDLLCVIMFPFLR